MYGHDRNGYPLCVEPALQLVCPEHVRKFCVRCPGPNAFPERMTLGELKERHLTVNVCFWLVRARKVIVERLQTVIPRVRYPSMSYRRHLPIWN